MATYPVKLLIDKNGTAFIPVVNSDSIITPDGDTLDDLLDEKQDTLVSGTNLKTINNQSLLGSGNIDVSGGGGTPTDVQVNGTSITSSGVANLLTNSAYDSSSNKIATMSDIPEKQTFKISDILALSSTDTIWNDFLECVKNKKEFNVESGTVTTGRKTYEIIGTYFKKSSALLKIYYIDEDNIINEISVSYAMPSSKIVTQTTFTPLSTNKVKTTTSTTSGDVYDVTYINTMLGDIESLLGGI